jgi:hypothetical protein
MSEKFTGEELLALWEQGRLALVPEASGQLSRADLQDMEPKLIADALKAGRLNDLLAGKGSS